MLVFGKLSAAFVGIACDHLDGVEALIEAGGAVVGGGGKGGDVVAEDGDVHVHAVKGGLILLALLLEAVGGVADDAFHLTETGGEVEHGIVQRVDGGVEAALKPAQAVAHGIRFGAIALRRNNWCAVERVLGRFFLRLGVHLLDQCAAQHHVGQVVGKADAQACGVFGRAFAQRRIDALEHPGRHFTHNSLVSRSSRDAGTCLRPRKIRASDCLKERLPKRAPHFVHRTLMHE